ncbi:hypothetical protein ABC255_28460 [Neobacillus sp. 3P2-tot-E-2]|uniref:hypothetical protein n=1 Tax=Neobacillus sp. 3P2-tot-E-2 TaxID=3132212 RepID=UPI0039A14586
MKITKKVQSILLPFVLLIGVTGCMNGKSSEDKILSYLEETYKESFEVEVFNEGSTMLKNMYGGDDMIVHPKGKPEHVFLAGEDRDHEGKYFDTYVLSKWAYELTKKLEPKINTLFPGVADYRALMYVEDGKYDPSMKDMSVYDYFAKVNRDADVIVTMAIKTATPPTVSEYNEAVYQMLQELKTLNVQSYGVTVGFVEQDADMADYIRTSQVNNLQWSNLKSKVYGTIMVDSFANITDSKQIEQYYEMFEE